jgi:hypothetical protein
VPISGFAYGNPAEQAEAMPRWYSSKLVEMANTPKEAAM